jgi:DNA polymerase-3 subunit alpha
VTHVRAWHCRTAHRFGGGILGIDRRIGTDGTCQDIGTWVGFGHHGGQRIGDRLQDLLLGEIWDGAESPFLSEGRLSIWREVNRHADFVHLHVHSQYSLLDGACRIPELVAAAQRHRMPALALTDHGNLFGLIEFYDACMKGGVKPILGVEAYIAPGSRFDKEAKGISEASFHLILLAKDEVGYGHLMKLVTLANLEGFYYRPRIDKELLRRYAKGLICLSGCLQGEVSYWLARGEEAKARQAAGELAEIFPKGDFYLEIQDHGIAEQRKIIPGILRLADDLSLPVVATNDLHYLEPSQARAHEVLLCIQTQTTLDDPKRFRFDSDEFYFKSPDQMQAIFGKEMARALLNTLEVAEKANVELEFNRPHLPQFVPPDGKTQEEYLRQLVEEGLRRRYPEVTEAIRNRIEHELKVITQTGFTSYFLITWDFVRYAKMQGIPVGPGRGSAAGSLVSYCLGITDLDPLRHALLFERFLNPDRVSMPDIDIDFCYERRGEVIEYVMNRYGRGNVAQVITFGTLQAKAVVRDVARAMGFSYPEADRIAKMIPAEPNMTLKRALQLVPELKALYEGDPRIQQLLNTSMVLEGLTRHASTHAAGIVIADGDLTQYVPLTKTAEGQLCTGYAMESLEKLGLLKIDFLGLRTLTVIEEASQMIRHHRKIPFEIGKIPLDDPLTYAMLSRGECTGVFQLESSGMRELVRRLKPDRFEDLIALVALFRPGMVEDFIRRRHGQIRVTYDHPQLEPILKDTYGTILFQEQVMQIAHELAGFTLSEADTLRRAMGKKTPEIMEENRDRFIQGCIKNGIQRKVAEHIFKKIEYFAGYAFNRSHSAAYALLAYQTAYLKANHPVEFMTALLSSERENTEKIAQYVEEARRMGIVVRPPDVQRSSARFTVEDGAIRFGLLAIKNVGSKAIESILEARQQGGPFTSLVDFCSRVDTRAVNRKVLESLIKCGAIDSLGLNRAQAMAILDRAMEVGARRQKEKSGGQLSLFALFGGGEARSDEVKIPMVEDWPKDQRLAFERALLGFYLTGHPLDPYRSILPWLADEKTSGLRDRPEGSSVTLVGVVNHPKITTTKKGNERMAVFLLEDLEGSVEVLVFPKIFPKMEPILQPGAVILLTARVSLREESPRLIAEEASTVEEALKKRIRTVRIHLDPHAETSLLEALRQLLRDAPGSTPVELAIGNGEAEGWRVSVGPNFHVEPSVDFFQKLVGLVGPQSVSVAKTL